jgi:hypothetical protein
VQFGEWLCSQVLKSVPHRQWVFSLPKRLRIYFLFDRKLPARLSRRAWKVLSIYLMRPTRQTIVPLAYYGSQKASSYLYLFYLSSEAARERAKPQSLRTVPGPMPVIHRRSSDFPIVPTLCRTSVASTVLVSGQSV